MLMQDAFIKQPAVVCRRVIDHLPSVQFVDNAREQCMLFWPEDATRLFDASVTT